MNLGMILITNGIWKEKEISSHKDTVEHPCLMFPFINNFKLVFFSIGMNKSASDHVILLFD